MQKDESSSKEGSYQPRPSFLFKTDFVFWFILDILLTHIFIIKYEPATLFLGLVISNKI